MNLQPLFETQKKLMDRIGYNEPDRFEKTILALLVEVGECANEWRGFKYWSKDQKPRTVKLYKIKNNGLAENPLLEEYVDGLHFVLQLGIEIDYLPNKVGYSKLGSITDQFQMVFWDIANFRHLTNDRNYHFLFRRYIGLGEMLGFTWEQIEQAYMDKNKVNHLRQDEGY
jgi:dimeric dUTPase (all-alpha-NTP-PPase superfamily)